MIFCNLVIIIIDCNIESIDQIDRTIAFDITQTITNLKIFKKLLMRIIRLSQIQSISLSKTIEHTFNLKLMLLFLFLHHNVFLKLCCLGNNLVRTFIFNNFFVCVVGSHNQDGIFSMSAVRFWRIRELRRIITCFSRLFRPYNLVSTTEHALGSATHSIFKHICPPNASGRRFHTGGVM